MKTFIIATGFRYTCNDSDTHCRQLLEHLDTDRPELLLILGHDPEYGKVVSVEDDAVPCAKIGRGDIGYALSAMKQAGQQAIAADIVEVNHDSQYAILELHSDSQLRPEPCNETDWDKWPRLNNVPQLTALRRERTVSNAIAGLRSLLDSTKPRPSRTAVAYIKRLIDSCRTDVTIETQKAVHTLRDLILDHPDNELRSFKSAVIDAEKSLGSRRRIDEFRKFWADLEAGDDALEQMNQWMQLLGRDPSAEKIRESIDNTLDDIEENLRQLPKGAYRYVNDYGRLMHNIVYKKIPRDRWFDLVETLMLRQHLGDMWQEYSLKPRRNATGQHPAHMEMARTAAFVKELKACFYGDEAKAEEFLDEIEGRTPRQITGLVNLWVRQRLISREMCHRTLWTLLHDNGYYDRTEANWNSQID